MIYTFSRNRSDQFSSQKLSPEVDRTGADLILISVTKRQETSVMYIADYLLLIYIFFYVLIVILL